MATRLETLQAQLVLADAQYEHLLSSGVEEYRGGTEGADQQYRMRRLEELGAEIDRLERKIAVEEARLAGRQRRALGVIRRG